MKINKRGAAPAVVYWIIAIAIGLFLADKAGFFATYLPNPSAQGKPPELVNLYFYDDSGASPGTNPAVPNYVFNCALNSLVFRSKNTNWGDTSNWMVLFRNNSYYGYPYSANVKNPYTGPIKIPSIPYIIYENGNDLFTFHENLTENDGDLCLICENTTYGLLKDISSSPTACSVSISDTWAKFRTTDLTYSPGSSIAYYLDGAGQQLTSFGFANRGVVASCSGIQELTDLPGGPDLYASSNNLIVCSPETINSHTYVKFRTTDTAYDSGSTIYYYQGTPESQLIQFDYFSRSGIISNCNIITSTFGGIFIETVISGGQLYLKADKSRAYICMGTYYTTYANSDLVSPEPTGSNEILYTINYNSIIYTQGGSAPTTRDYTPNGLEMPYTVVYPYCNTHKTIINSYYYRYSRNATPPVDSQYLVQAPVLGTYEYYNDGASGSNPYIFAGFNYTCRDSNSDGVNDVVAQRCAQNAEGNNYTILQTCESGQQCRWFSASETAGLFQRPAVKCGESIYWYTPNKQLCRYQPGDSRYTTTENNYFYQTNLLGTAISQISCDTTFAGRCVQDINTQTVKIAHCMNCSSSVQRCDPQDNKVIQTCQGDGSWFSAEPCPGIQVCQDPQGDGTYECNADFIDNQPACGGQGYPGLPSNTKQRYKYQIASGTWITNGAECRTQCNAADRITCTNDCDWAEWGSCSGGIISHCDRNTDTGNIIDYGTNPPRTCAYPVNEQPQCNSAGTGCNATYELNKRYCIGGYIKLGVTGGDPLTEGGVDLSNYYQCVIGCMESQPAGTATCLPSVVPPASKCHSMGQIVCDGLFQQVQCTEYMDNIQQLPGGGTPPSSHHYCDDSNYEIGIDAQWLSYPTDCVGSMKCLDGTTIHSCDTSGYFDGRFTETCGGNGCTESTPGHPQCNTPLFCAYNFSGDLYYGCEGALISWPCARVSVNDYDGTSIVKGAPSLLCSTLCVPTANPNQRCQSQCTGSQICQGGVVYPCDGGIIDSDSPKWNCNGKGCATDGVNCRSECGPGITGEEAIYHCEGSISKYCSPIYGDPENPSVITQRIYVDTLCPYACEPTTGQCQAQCPVGADSYCANDNTIHECIDGSDSGVILTNCMGRGCTTVGIEPVCVNDCSSSDVDKGLTCLNPSGQSVTSCTGVDCGVIICRRNETVVQGTTYTQFYNSTVSCGSSGCAYSGNQYSCSGDQQYANSFDCTRSSSGAFTGEIWRTDENGVAYELFDNCNIPPKTLINGLNPYCKRGHQFCYYCERNQLYCVNSQVNRTGLSFTCVNGTTGEVANSQICNIGCHSGHCDDSFMMLPDTTNFPVSSGGASTGNIIMQLTLKGSPSEEAISGATITAVLSGTGITPQTRTGLMTLQDGTLANPIQFGSIPKGIYNITVTVEGYGGNNVQVIPVVITDSFVVRKYLVDVLYVIPGVSPTIEIQVSSSNGAVPDSLFISSHVNMTTAPTVVRSQDHPERWILTIPADIEPGDYYIGFKPSQSGVDASEIIEQKLKFTVSTPQLKVDINSPQSATLGKHEYVVSLTGPAYEDGILKTTSLTPDIVPKATITSAEGSSDVTLLDQGGGRYLLNYDFPKAGTYTIYIEATKAGYGGGILSKLIQISSSGADLPPGSDGSGMAGSGFIGGLTSGGVPTYIIIGLGLVVAYLIFSRRKRR
jgi:hypothetical protein